MAKMKNKTCAGSLAKCGESLSVHGFMSAYSQALPVDNKIRTGIFFRTKLLGEREKYEMRSIWFEYQRESRGDATNRKEDDRFICADFNLTSTRYRLGQNKSKNSVVSNDVTRRRSSSLRRCTAPACSAVVSSSVWSRAGTSVRCA